jgi:hypothetical protein
MERRGTPVTSLIADGVAESAAAQSAAAAAAGSADPVELDDTGFRAGSTGGGGSGGCAAPMPAEVEEEEVGEEGEEGEEGKVGEEGEVGEVEVGEVGEGPRDPRRPWAGTKPALKPLDGITDEQASMFSVLSWGCRSSLPRPTRMRASGSRLLCRGVAQPRRSQWQRVALLPPALCVCQRRSLVPATINAQSGAADPRGGAQEQAPLPTGRRLIRLGRSCGGTRGSLGVSCRLTALEFSCPRRARPSCGHLSSLRGPFFAAQKSTRITF